MTRGRGEEVICFSFFFSYCLHFVLTHQKHFMLITQGSVCGGTLDGKR